MTERSSYQIPTSRKYGFSMRREEIDLRKENPIIKADFPDADVIRVEDTYYMLCSTLHFLPGAVILRSYDLMNWEIMSYVFETFEGTEEARMTNEKSNYGDGMWAGSLRYHKGRFYVSFAAKETAKTYFYSAESPRGPWESKCIDFYFHQGSLFFDDDDKVYLVFGHKELWIREMLPDLSGLKPGGFARRVVNDEMDSWMACEGTHFYKINGKYYLFAVQWPKEGMARRQQICYMAESLDGEFRGKTVLNDNMNYRNDGIAQGGLVQTNDGNWWAVLMQDRGAAGRSPVLVPVKWKGDYPEFGVSGKVPEIVENASNRPYYEYEPLYTSDAFDYQPEEDGRYILKPQWQWNHEPNNDLWEIDQEGGLVLTTGKICSNVTQTYNTLTQRMFFPKSAVEVTVDASDLDEGDYAGLCALQGCYRMVAITRELRRYYLVVIMRMATDKNRNSKSADYMPGYVVEKINLTSSKVRLRMETEFEDEDTVQFYYREPREGGKWRKIGPKINIYFGLDHFSGCRCGLSVFATKSVGGSAKFEDFRYEY